MPRRSGSVNRATGATPVHLLSEPSLDRRPSIFLVVVGVADREAAVDDQGVAVDVAGFVRGEEEGGVGDLVGDAAALQRIEMADTVFLTGGPGPFVDGARHSGLDQAGQMALTLMLAPASWVAATLTRLITPA